MRKLLVVMAVSCLAVMTASSMSRKKEEVSSEMPLWIETPYKVYSREAYFASSGSGRNKNSAEYKAVESLAAVFGQDVTSSNEAVSSIIQSQTSAGTETVKSDSLNSQILISIDQKDLIGIEIAETWFDENNSEWYALAVLDKEKTADLYTSLIKSNAESIQTLRNKAETLPSSMEKAACLYKAGQISLLNESYFTRFFLIHPEKCTAAKSMNIPYENIRAEFDAVAALIPVAVELSGDSDRIAENSCSELLKSYGLTVSDDSPSYILKMYITKTYRTVDNPVLYYCEFIISAYMTDNSGEKLVPWTFYGRAGAKTEELAAQKAYILAAEKIKTEYKNVFDDYLLGESDR